MAEYQDRLFHRYRPLSLREDEQNQKRLSGSRKGSHKYILMAAIDFGTTYSGYAFSFTSNKDDIRMNKNWGSEVGFLSYKTPTSVLLTPEEEFKAFGFDAVKKYADLEDNDARNHFYFHRFKMKLHSMKTLTRDTTIKDANGKRLPALDIFAHAMRYLKDHMMKAIKQSIPSEMTLEDDDICWVLTVPAIWDDNAKQFMRQAAYKAGIASEAKEGQLLIALEPEAGGICCHQDPTQNHVVDLEPGDRYMIVDCGGGTVDITVHESSRNGKAKEVITPTGGHWGGTRVDEQFLKLLDNIFGKDIMARYKAEYPNEYLSLLIEFETKKRSTLLNPPDDEPVVVAIHLGFNFFQFYPRHSGGRNVQQAIKEYKSQEVVFSNGLIRMNHSIMKSFFTPTIDSILDHLDQLLAREAVMPLKYMFMIGGFSESPILQHAVRERFEHECDVIVPDGCGLAIIKGAVIFGHNPSFIAARKSKYTYGVEISPPFDPDRHPARLKGWREDKVVCNKVFSKCVEAGQLVEVGETSEKSYEPVTRSQEGIEFNIFRTTKKHVSFCDEEGVTKCGYVDVDIPPFTGGLNRDVRVTFTFGETEIKVDAFALGTGERASTKIDFLQA